MSSAIVQLLVLAGIAVFLILRLRNVLGTRDGFEKPPVEGPVGSAVRRDLKVIEGGPDRDITDHVKDGSPAAKALAEMKKADDRFTVTDFLSGARGAYEMILMAFERGDLDSVKPFLAEDVYEAFAGVVEDRKQRGVTIDATFVGVRELALMDAEFDPQTREAEITVRFIGELTSVVRDSDGQIIEGNPNEIRRQRDVWTFARTMGAPDPNWQLVATSE